MECTKKKVLSAKTNKEINLYNRNTSYTSKLIQNYFIRTKYKMLLKFYQGYQIRVMTNSVLALGGGGPGVRVTDEESCSSDPKPPDTRSTWPGDASGTASHHDASSAPGVFWGPCWAWVGHAMRVRSCWCVCCVGAISWTATKGVLLREMA